jgi:hypothetical protein
VTLSDNVDWLYQKWAAEEGIRGFSGVAVIAISRRVAASYVRESIAMRLLKEGGIRRFEHHCGYKRRRGHVVGPGRGMKSAPECGERGLEGLRRYLCRRSHQSCLNAARACSRVQAQRCSVRRGGYPTSEGRRFGTTYFPGARMPSAPCSSPHPLVAASRFLAGADLKWRDNSTDTLKHFTVRI